MNALHKVSKISSNPFIPAKAVIKDIKTETKDIKTYTISPETGMARHWKFEPGQFNMLSISGVGEFAVSFSSAEPNGDFKHTVKAVGRVTTSLARLKTGDFVGIRGPYGTYWPTGQFNGKNVLIVAGGIGIAPLHGVIQQIIKNKNDYKSLNILYGAKKLEDMLFKDKYENWEKEGANLLLTLDEGEPDKWPYHTGVVTALFKKLSIKPSETIALICGPEIMMRFCVIELLKQGYLADQIYISLERRMDCAIQMCGHCMLGHFFICKDGPVFSYEKVKGVFGKIA